MEKHWLLIFRALHRRRIRHDLGSIEFMANGFTLLELLIVVIIVGILAAFSAPNLLAQIDKARYSEATIRMKCLADELIAYRMEKGTFPPDTSRNQKPDGIECFYTQNNGKVPFNSKYDYDSNSNSSSCYIHIVFLGENADKEVPNNGNCSGGHEGMRVAGSQNLELRRSEPLCLTSRGLKPY